jgi:hypothetical protein
LRFMHLKPSFSLKGLISSAFQLRFSQCLGRNG